MFGVYKYSMVGHLLGVGAGPESRWHRSLESHWLVGFVLQADDLHRALANSAANYTIILHPPMYLYLRPYGLY